MSEETGERPRLHFDPSDVVLEIVSIVVAIVLATAVGQFVDHLRNVQRTHEALVEIRQELVSDHATLEERRPVHRRLYASFLSAVTHASAQHLSFDAFRRAFRTAAPFGAQPFDGTTTAWDLAQTSTVLSDVPYRTRAVLQARFAELATLRSVNASLIEHLEPATYADRPNFYFTANAAALVLSDIVYSENRLARDDAAALAELARAGAGESP